MHIPDGFLSGSHIVGSLNTFSYVVSIGVCGYAIKRIRQEMEEMRIPLLGISAVFLLVAQMLNLPVEGAISAHFVGAVLLASLLGPWATCLIMAVVLTIQCLFGYGSLATLGTNLFNLGIVGGIGGYYILMGLKNIFPHSRKGFSLVLAVSTWTSIMLVTLAIYLELVISGMVEINLLNMLGVQGLIGMGEAAITVGLVSLIIGARPDLVITYCCGGDKDSCYAHHHHVSTHTHQKGEEHDHGHIY